MKDELSIYESHDHVRPAGYVRSGEKGICPFSKTADQEVQALVVTEKQFAKIEYILGNASSEVLTSDERIVFL